MNYRIEKSDQWLGDRDGQKEIINIQVGNERGRRVGFFRF